MDYYEYCYFTYYLQSNYITSLLSSLDSPEFWKSIICEGSLSIIEVGESVIKLKNSNYIYEALKYRNKQHSFLMVKALVEKHDCPVDKMSILYAIRYQNSEALDFLSTKYNEEEFLTVNDLIHMYTDKPMTYNRNMWLSDILYIIKNIRNERLWLRAIQLGKFEVLQQVSKYLLLQEQVYIKEAIKCDINSEQVIGVLKDFHKLDLSSYFLAGYFLPNSISNSTSMSTSTTKEPEPTPEIQHYGCHDLSPVVSCEKQENLETLLVKSLERRRKRISE